jgi:hypothetical protein
MKKITFTHLVLMLIVGLGCGISYGQTIPWSGAYGNEWIVEGQEYAVIKVKSKGIYQINKSDLPAEFPAFDSGRLQLWHRGKQVAILAQDMNKVVFYGVPNDGSFDELLARQDRNRPEIVGRMNKYVSLFSENSFYFLTVDTRSQNNGFAPPIGVQSVNLDALPSSSTSETFHVKTDTLLFTNEFSTSGTYSTYPAYFNSFYDYSQTFTSTRLGRTATFLQPFTLKNLHAPSSQPVRVKVLLHNRGKLDCRININIKSKGGANRLVSTIDVREFKASEYEFNLNTATDIDLNGEGELTFSVNNGVIGNFFSVSYVSLTYPQNLSLDNKTLYTLTLPGATIDGVSQVNLSGLPTGEVKLLDITEPGRPIIYNTSNPANFRINRNQSQGKVLLAYSAVKNILRANTYRYVGLSKNYDNYKNKDYIIITTKSLETSAKKYSDYRGTTYNRTTKSNFQPLLVNIEDIYNQYNYGEPSPVAIRRFVDYLVSDGNFNRSLFLIGNSTTLNKGSMELVGEVPTVGYPGSDFLLVSGLGGTREDFQTIAVGRLPVGTTGKIDDYLNKVKKYEDYTDVIPKTWRKNIVHYAGGKSTQEINRLKNALIDASNSFVVPNGGTTFSYAKDENNPCPPDANGFTDCQTYASPEIAQKVNEGAGVLTYYGHGNTRVTDYYAGYVTDPGRGYNNSGKYPGYFLYGCDVNNVFVGLNENIAYSLTNFQRRPFTVDWLITPDKGAITVVGNSWEGYESTLTPYMRKIYEKLFVQDLDKMTLGDVLKTVSNSTISSLGYPVVPNNSSYNYNFTQANVHQTVLLGDPAIILLLTTSPSSLPVTWLQVKAKVTNASEVSVEWSTASETNNERFVIQRSRDGKQFEDIGSVDGKGNTSHHTEYSYIDRSPLWGKSYYRILQLDSHSSNNGDGTSKSTIVSVENGSDDHISVYPNPSANVIKISSLASEVLSWQLQDELGRILKFEGSTSEINLDGLSEGSYFVRITTKDGEVITKRFVKGRK